MRTCKNELDQIGASELLSKTLQANIYAKQNCKIENK